MPTTKATSTARSAPSEIVNALKRNKITIAQDQVRLQGPLKELGLYTIKIHVAQEIEGDLKVWVVPSVAEEARRKKNPPAERTFSPRPCLRWGPHGPGPLGPGAT